MSDETLTFNIQGLEKLLKALKAKPPQARVGILSSGATRGDNNGSSNAEIGAVHEFGAPKRNIPPRSFLRVPISENLGKEMEKSGAFDADTISEVLKEGSVIPWLRKIAVLAEGCVSDAFATGGGGKWAPWKRANYTNNANMLLVDTTQLRASVTSEVKE